MNSPNASAAGTWCNTLTSDSISQLNPRRYAGLVAESRYASADATIVPSGEKATA